MDQKHMIGTDAYLRHSTPYDDYFYLLPEDIQEGINKRAERRHFRSAKELRHYVEYLVKRS